MPAVTTTRSPNGAVVAPIDPVELCVRSMQIMRSGSRADFEEVIHPEAVNREAKDEPPECRAPGPAALYATALWLRGAFSDLDFEVHEAVTQGDLVVIHNTMSGRHTGAMVEYDERARPSQVFPPTGRRFASTQTHWLRVKDGQVIEHWANRDDLATALQLGWIPPRPLYLVRMLVATARARLGARRA